MLRMQRRIHVCSGVCVTVAGQKHESQVLVGAPFQTICKAICKATRQAV